MAVGQDGATLVFGEEPTWRGTEARTSTADSTRQWTMQVLGEVSPAPRLLLPEGLADATAHTSFALWQRGLGNGVGRVLQRGRAHGAVVVQEGQANLVPEVVQRGASYWVRLQQQGIQHDLMLRQGGDDSTARVRQRGVGNEAVITQYSVAM